MCSISGLVSTTLAFLRAHARSSVGGVAVVGHRAQARARATSAASAAGPARAPWSGRSAARCRAGRRRPTRRSAPGSRATCPTRCRSRPRRSCPARSRSIAAAWCVYSRSMPRAAMRRRDLGGQRRGQLGELRRPRRAGSRGARAGRRARGRRRARRAWRTRPSRGEGTDRLRRRVELCRQARWLADRGRILS